MLPLVALARRAGRNQHEERDKQPDHDWRAPAESGDVGNERADMLANEGVEQALGGG